MEYGSAVWNDGEPSGAKQRGSSRGVAKQRSDGEPSGAIKLKVNFKNTKITQSPTSFI